MRGSADAAYMAAIGVESPDLVVRELEENLRALLRDMVCGHIDANVRGIADDLLPPEEDPAAQAVQEPPEPSFVVRRGREATTDTLLGIDDAPGLFDHTDTHVAVTERPQPEPESEPEPKPERDEPEEHSEGSTDWGLDDDAGDYSAAV